MIPTWPDSAGLSFAALDEHGEAEDRTAVLIPRARWQTRSRTRNSRNIRSRLTTARHRPAGTGRGRRCTRPAEHRRRWRNRATMRPHRACTEGSRCVGKRFSGGDFLCMAGTGRTLTQVTPPISSPCTMASPVCSSTRQTSSSSSSQGVIQDQVAAHACLGAALPCSGTSGRAALSGESANSLESSIRSLDCLF